MKYVLPVLAVLAVASAAMAAPILSVSVADHSGDLMGGYTAAESIDDNTGTLWYSEMSNDVAAVPYAVYAFDAVYEVGDVTITMSSGNFRKLDIAALSVSTDGVNFAPAGTFNIDVADGALTVCNLGGVLAQYVRLDGVGAHYNNWNGDPVDKATPGTAPDGKYAISYAEIDFDAVPEPATLSLLAVGAAGLLRRKRA